jgi:hypothetical protein
MKDMMGAALLGELMAALARSNALRKSLAGIPPEEADAVLRRLVSELERLASEGAAQSAPRKPSLYPISSPAPRPEGPTLVVREPPRTPDPVPAPVPPVTAPPPPDLVAPKPKPVAPPATPVVEAPVQRPAAAAPSAPVAAPVAPPPAPSKPFPAPPPSVLRTVPPEQAPRVAANAPREVPAKKVAPPKADPPPPPPVLEVIPEIVAVPEPPPSPLRNPGARVPVVFEDDTAFVLAASLIPLQDSSSLVPFGAGVNGVEQGSEIFAFDHAGIRFFLSPLKSQEASVSRTGVLLLGKQESIRHRNVHERLVNALRPDALVLPAEPGTVVFGRHDLVRRVDFRVNALFELLLSLATLTNWRVNVSVLDASVQKTLPAEQVASRPGRQEADRGRVPSASRKTDIKTLERMLNREKKLAEAILQRLAAAAVSHAVESMVNIGSGVSEDWKPILKASFEVPAARHQEFMRGVLECQETHAQFGPMLSVVGGPGSFSLSM